MNTKKNKGEEEKGKKEGGKQGRLKVEQSKREYTGRGGQKK